MRRLLFVFLTIILFFCSSIFARVKYSNYAQRGGKDVKTSSTTTYELMETYPTCTITVYLAGTTTLASIFADNVGSPKANPFTADTTAYYEFYADNGVYDIKFSGTGIASPFTKANITLIDVTTIGPIVTLKTNGTNNPTQTILNLKNGSNINIVDDGVGGITISSTTIGITLKTNGVNNGSQALLNLKPGSYITVTDDGVGGVTIASTINLKALTTWYDAKIDCGMQADGSDDTPELQACINTIAATNVDGTIFFPRGVYTIAGALTDVAGCNCQIKLPSRNGNQIAITFLGASPISNAGTNVSTSGAVLKSTLATGTGNMIGAYGTAFNNRTDLFFYIKDMMLRGPINPTISILDPSNILQTSLENIIVDTGETYASTTEPTTATSYGIKLPVNNTAALAMMRNVSVSGFYNGIRWGELTNASDGIAVTHTKYAIEIPASFHSTFAGRVLLVNNTNNLHYVGGRSTGSIINLDIEHPVISGAWFDNVSDINDPSNFGYGTIIVHLVAADVGVIDDRNYGGTASPTTLNIVGGERLHVNLLDNVPTQIFTGYRAQLPKAFEINSGAAVSDDTKYPAFNFIHNQSGINNTIGVFTFDNLNIGGTEKRVAQFAAATSGAINSGEINFATANAGSVGLRLKISPTGIQLNGGSDIKYWQKGSVTIDPASINATTVSSQTFTLTGAIVGDSLTLNPPAAGLTVGMLVSQVFVSAADTITVVFYNTTGAPIDLASASWTYQIVR